VPDSIGPAFGVTQPESNFSKCSRHHKTCVRCNWYEILNRSKARPIRFATIATNSGIEPLHKNRY